MYSLLINILTRQSSWYRAAGMCPGIGPTPGTWATYPELLRVHMRSGPMMCKRTLSWSSPSATFRSNTFCDDPWATGAWQRYRLWMNTPWSLVLCDLTCWEALSESHLSQKQIMLFANRTSLSSHLDTLKSWLQLIGHVPHFQFCNSLHWLPGNVISWVREVKGYGLKFA